MGGGDLDWRRVEAAEGGCNYVLAMVQVRPAGIVAERDQTVVERGRTVVGWGQTVGERAETGEWALAGERGEGWFQPPVSSAGLGE